MRATVISARSSQFFFAVPSDTVEEHFQTHGPNAKSGYSILCHQTDCDFDVLTLRNFDVVEINSVESAPKGLRGSGVAFVERPPLDEWTGTVQKGIKHDRGFAFATTPDDRLIFLHISEFCDYDGEGSAMFDALQPGDSVTGEMQRSLTKRPRGIRISRTRVRS